MQIVLTSLQTDKKIKEFIDTAVKEGVLLGIGAFAGGHLLKLLTSVVKTGVASIFENQKETDNSIVIGKLEFPIHELGTGDYTFNLSTTQELIFDELIFQDDKIIKRTKKIPKGMGIAQVVLSFEVFDEQEELLIS